MEEALDPVVLNVYELSSPEQEQQSSISSFFQRVLPQAGLGAYHTSLDVNGYCYTFGVGGIRKSAIANKSAHVPPNSTFRESITLGSLNVGYSRINEVVKRLRNTSFTETSYHLLNRNCNHFTETFATALIVADDLIDENPPPLETYPKWINRLARTSTNFMNHGDVCDVLKEARVAAGVDGKIGWDLSTSATQSRNRKSSSSSKKKVLTEAQKKALAKLKK